MRRILWIVLVVMFLALVVLGYVFFGGVGSLVVFFGVILYVVLIAFLLTCVSTIFRVAVGVCIRSLRVSIFPVFARFFKSYVLVFGYLLVLVPLVFAFLIYGFNTWWYGEVSRYEVSDGEKKIIFQSMSHLASSEFYDEVIDDLETKGDDGYVLFYEGVRPGSRENEKAFSQALGFSVDRGFYTDFGRLADLQFQGDRDFLGYTVLDVNVDLSIDDIMSIYSQSPRQAVPSELTPSVEDMFEELGASYDALTPKAQKSISYGYRAAFNAILHFVKKADMTLPVDEVPIFQVILDDRNQHIARSIHESEHDKIYLTYGALHFDGILEELRRLGGEDSWEVVDTSNLRVIYPN